MAVTITDVKTFITAPGRCDLVVVKVETSDPGLYGYGCATFTQRALAVKTALDEYLRPMMIGRNPANIEDAWQVMYGSSYWRNGPVLNNAISGVEEALWDIKGKMAGMPVYDLIGGKCREAVRIFSTAHGSTLEAIGEQVQALLDAGQNYIRLFYMKGERGAINEQLKPIGAPKGHYFDTKQLRRNYIELFEYLRGRFGDDPEFMIDVHEQFTPTETIMLAKEMEPYHLFFLEDSLTPENIDWFANMRQAVSTPLAMGELFNNINEIKPLIENRQIDYIRCHISQLGGFNPARKLAAYCELYGISTIWHGPGDICPVGMMAQVHLDLSSANCAFQEFGSYSDIEKEMFPGLPELKGNYLYANDKPGWGVDFDEEMAKKYPPIGYKSQGFMARTSDGTAVRS